MYRRALAALTLTACILATTTACIPKSHPRLRWSQCKVVWFDTTSTGAPASYIAEVSKLTGLKFVKGSRATAERQGLLVTDLRTSDPRLGGRTSTSTSTDGHSDYLVHATIAVLPSAPPGMWRHELGHLFNLAHNPGSALMRKAPAAQATYSSSEIAVMRDVATRSGCGTRSASFGGR